jgi:ATP/maltotriose-dependent transcriptional regulator MalT
MLPAYVEIMLTAHEITLAREAADELSKIAEAFEASFLRASAAHAQGAVSLAEDDPAGALTQLHKALSIFGRMDAAYESARVRVMIGLACRALGDADTAEIEFEAAQQVLQRLGARSDIDRLRKLINATEVSYSKGLTAREIQVLGLVAQGRTNREISSTLVISEHTAARHLQNIFGKLGVSSRTAAAAFAIEHNLI